MIDVTRWALLAQRRGRRSRAASPVNRPEDIVGWVDGTRPICWPTPSREHAGHAVVLGSSGAGKTLLKACAAVQGLRRVDGCDEEAPTLAVVDAKGDLVEAILSGICAVCPWRLRDVVYLDSFGETGFPFDLLRLRRSRTPIDIFALQLAQLAAEVSTSTGAQAHLGVGARQLDVLVNVILAALTSPVPGANLLWALDALTVPHGLRRLALVTSSIRARQFLASAQLSDELRASCSSRLRTAFAASDSLERLVCAGRCIQPDELLGPGKIVLVHLGRPFGGLTSLQVFYAQLLVHIFVEHLMERESPWRGHACELVIDEAQIVAGVLAERAEAVLTTGRSRGLSLTVMSQGTTLIKAASETLLRVLMTNAPTRFIGRLSAPDAELLAREQAPSLGVDESVPSVRSRFSAAVTNLADREWFRLLPGRRDRFRSAEVDVHGWRAAAHAHAGEVSAVIEQLAVPPRDGRVLLTDVVSDAVLRSISHGSGAGRRHGRGHEGAPR